MIALPSDRVPRSDFFVRFTSRQGSASDVFFAAAHVSGAQKKLFSRNDKKVLTSECTAFIMQAEKKCIGGVAVLLPTAMTKNKPFVPAEALNEEKFVKTAGNEEELLQKDDVFLNAFKTGGRKKRSAVKTLLVLYKGNYKKLSAAVLLMALKEIPVVMNSVITADIINEISRPTANSYRMVIIYIVALIAMIAVNLISDVFFVRFTRKAIRSVEANLRSALIRKLHMLSIGYYKHIQSGKLQYKIIRDVEAISELSANLLTSFMMVLLDFLFSVSITLYKSPVMFLFFLVLVPVNVFIVRMFRGKLQKSNSIYRKEMENTSAKVIESMELIPVTKAHGLENTQVEKMDRQFEKVAKDAYKLDKTNTFFNRVIWASNFIIRLLCLAFTSFLVIRGTIRVGDVVMYQSYFSIIVGAVTAIINIVPTISRGMESVNSVGDILIADDIEDNYHKLKPPHIKGNVTFDDVSFRYDDGNKNVLDHFSLDVSAGETIAFVGESGCGKTTAINLIIGFGRATDGRVLIDGMNINNFNLHEYRSQLAVVPQTPILFGGTIRENIVYGYDHISDATVNKAVDEANLREFIDSLPEGINTVIGEHGGTLSGGQRQRIAIARALIRNPSIVILDEATSALDTISEKKIQIAINNVAKDRTTFIVAHRLSTIRNADRIVVVKNGKCAECGSYDELMAKKGLFYEMQTLQNE